MHDKTSIKKMSSHHIVKDKQEPALLIANGEACTYELLGQLLEWSPTVIVLDGAANRVMDLGVKMDIILGDFDSLKGKEKILERYQDVKFIHTPDQNKTDLDKGIEYLIKEGFPAVNIVWATGLRADHTITNLTNIVKYKNEIDIVMFNDNSKIFPLGSTFKKCYPQGTPISIIPIGKSTGITTSGLKYNLDNDYLELGSRTGSSNETKADGFIEITHQQGHLLLMECWD